MGDTNFTSNVSKRLLGTRSHQEAISERRMRRQVVEIAPISSASATSTNSPTTSTPPPSTTSNATPLISPASNATESNQQPDSSLPSTRLSSMTANQAAISRGYQDGFTSAKVFAQYGMSRIGFIGQYIADSLDDLVTDQEVDRAHSGTYTTWFLRGVSDGEAQISAAITGTAPAYAHPSGSSQ